MRWLSLLLAGLFLFAACGAKEDTAPPREDVKKEKLGTGKGRKKRKARPRKKRDKAPDEEPKEGYLRVLTSEEIQQILDKVKDLPFVPVEEDEVGVIETDRGDIVIQFFPDVAPNHCANFKKLANAGYFDGIKFHRIVRNTIIQGGCIFTRDADPGNDGGGFPGYRIKAEFNNKKHKKGTLSMARDSHPDSAGSQFFICLNRQRTRGLDGKYTVFGEVIQGIEVVDRIGSVPLRGERPVNPPVIKRVYMKKKEE